MNFTPTDEQLFDYFIGDLDPETARHVSVYLESHPEIQNRFADYRDIQQSYSRMPLTGPNDQVLARVLDQAKKELAPGFWQFLRMPVLRRSVAYALMTGFVVVVGLTVNRMSTPPEAKFSTRSNHINPAFTSLSSDAATPPKTAENSANKVAIKTAIRELYAAANKEFDAGNFAQADQLFAEVMKKDPLFEAREELYGKWITALNKLSKFDQAEKLRLSLKKIMDEKKSR